MIFLFDLINISTHSPFIFDYLFIYYFFFEDRVYGHWNFFLHFLISLIQNFFLHFRYLFIFFFALLLNSRYDTRWKNKTFTYPFNFCLLFFFAYRFYVCVFGHVYVVIFCVLIFLYEKKENFLLLFLFLRGFEVIFVDRRNEIKVWWILCVSVSVLRKPLVYLKKKVKKMSYFMIFPQKFNQILYNN